MSHKEVPTNSTAYACHTPIQVRFRDLDAMAHVNNAVYFTYFEIGRETYMEAMGYAKEGTDDIHDRFPFILAEISCRYLRPVQPGETVTIHIRVNRLGNSSWGFQYLLTSDAHNEAVATSFSSQVFYDYTKGCPQRVPDAFAEAVERLERRSFPRPPP